MVNRVRVRYCEAFDFKNVPVVKGGLPCPKCRKEGRKIVLLAHQHSTEYITVFGGSSGNGLKNVPEYGNIICKVHGTFGYQVIDENPIDTSQE